MLVFPTFYKTIKPQFHTPRMSQASLRKWTVNRGVLFIARERKAERAPVVELSSEMTPFAPGGLWVG